MKTYPPPRTAARKSADFEPDTSGRRGVRLKVLELANQLKGTGFVLKVNSILRATGYDLIDEFIAVRSRSLRT